MDKLLSETDAAAILGCKPKTLKNWRSRDQGPPWYRVSKRAVRYRESELKAWIESVRVHSKEAGHEV